VGKPTLSSLFFCVIESFTKASSNSLNEKMFQFNKLIYSTQSSL